GGESRQGSIGRTQHYRDLGPGKRHLRALRTTSGEYRAHCQGLVGSPDQTEIGEICTTICVRHSLAESRPVQRDHSRRARPQGANGSTCPALLACEGMQAASKPWPWSACYDGPDRGGRSVGDVEP